MDLEAPKRADRRGFRRWIWIGVAGFPAAVFLLGNLWLASPFGCAWLAAKLQGRTGLETHVGGVSVTPWSGVVIRQIEMLQPAPLQAAVKQPLCRIEELRLTPVWRSWLRGKLELQSISLDSPQIVVTVEMLADIARPRTAAPTTSPPVAVVVPQPPATTAATPITPPETGAPQPKPFSPPLPPTGWIRLKNASFTLLSASSGRQWFQVSGVSGPLPVSGSPAQSVLQLGSIRTDGHEHLTNLSAGLDWQAPLLSLKPLEADLDGFHLVVTGKLGVASSIPLQIEARIPKQKPPAIKLPAEGHAEAETVVVNARFLGLLLAPSTWQGECVAEALAPSGRIAGHEAKFDRGSAVTVLRGGMLSCVDARFIGDELSLLGNATVLADGRFSAALRLVAPPDAATAIVNRVFPEIPQPPALTSLSTPQRCAFDLEAFGNFRQVFLRLGGDGPVVELKHTNTP